MRSEVCSVDGCDRIRDKKQNRLICQMHRTRYSRYKSYDLPTMPKLPDGVLKICKRHGELNSLQVYRRVKGKDWLSCRQCVKDCGRRFDDKTPSHLRNSYRKNYTVKGLKFSKEAYAELLAKQDNVCAICQRPESILRPNSQKTKRLAIDHCHKTNAVRGLLCHACNVSLGQMDDSIERLQAAIQYLQAHD